jgi:hypothetical protein
LSSAYSYSMLFHYRYVAVKDKASHYVSVQRNKATGCYMPPQVCISDISIEFTACAMPSEGPTGAKIGQEMATVQKTSTRAIHEDCLC